MTFPAEAIIPDVAAALEAGHDVVLTAPPGSGKTTCVPPALLDSAFLSGKKILMLEPRRLAARNSAAFIAKKIGSRLGGLVGYQVRLERMVSSETRLEILTEGLLSSRIMEDPELSEVGLIIFDEFHERSLQCDLAYALAMDVKRALRPDLRLIVMSATLDADEVMSSLAEGAERPPRLVRAEGRMFPVETRYLGGVSMSAAVKKALAETEGDVLAFLPGEGEIRRTAEALGNVPGAEVLPLYGSLPKEEQDRVFRPSPRRKLILSTSIAETSVTIEGITCVIDSGLMRVPRFSPSTGMSQLVTLPLTCDRAEQRRGRAGRVRAGVCYRLWTESEEASHPKKMMPEILDADLSSTVLTSAAWGAVKREDLPWMTLPPASAWEQAIGLLKLLGAIGGGSGLTEKGRKMSRMAMHPRLASMMMAGGDALFAAIIEEGARSRETDIRYVRPTDRVRQLAKRFDRQGGPSGRPLSREAALSLAYPDRVAKNRGNGTFTMVSGRGAFLPDDDPLAREPYLICCELDDRQGDAKIFLACPIAEAEIESLFGDEMTEESYCEWDRANERVKAVVRRRLGAMSFAEKPTGTPDPVEVAAALLSGIRQKGIENLPCWGKETLQLRARVDFLAGVLEGWPKLTDEAILKALPDFIDGMNKWKDLERLDIASVIDAILIASGHDRRELDRLAPTRMEVPSGSNMLIHYEGTNPTVEVRLQECFGLMATPSVAGGRVPIVMTLLSPAHRPCAVTKDLAGFWKEGYQLVRKDLRGRYPRHYWPEDPFTAVATRRVRPKG